MWFPLIRTQLVIVKHKTASVSNSPKQQSKQNKIISQNQVHQYHLFYKTILPHVQKSFCWAMVVLPGSLWDLKPELPLSLAVAIPLDAWCCHQSPQHAWQQRAQSLHPKWHQWKRPPKCSLSQAGKKNSRFPMIIGGFTVQVSCISEKTGCLEISMQAFCCLGSPETISPIASASLPFYVDTP